MILNTPGHWRASKPLQPQRSRAGMLQWTAEEDAALRKAYPDPAAIRAALPSRSAEAVRSRAYAIGLKIMRQKAWTAREMDLLRTLYPDQKKLHAGNFHTLFPKRTWIAIVHAAERIGITRAFRKMVKDPKHPDPVMQQIRERARSMGINMTELSSLLGMDRQTFSPGKARVNTNWAMVAKAVDELGGRLAIIWIEDEPEDVNATPLAVVSSSRAREFA